MYTSLSLLEEGKVNKNISFPHQLKVYIVEATSADLFLFIKINPFLMYCFVHKVWGAQNRVYMMVASTRMEPHVKKPCSEKL